MAHVHIIHRVDDYDAWKQVFDQAATLRRDAGERTYQVLRVEDDPTTIVHLSEWTSTAAARAFFESPELVRLRAEAGVHAPQFHYLELLEAGDL